MNMEMGRTPLEFRTFTSTADFEEQAFDLPVGARGFRLRVHSGNNNKEIRLSNIKGEVTKENGVYWSIEGAEIFDCFGDFRVMSEDAPEGDAKAGEVYEQRFYVAIGDRRNNQSGGEIELVILPGS